MLKQELVRGWLKGWKRVNKQGLQLCQQFMPEEFYFRVVGGEQGRLIRATREEIQGEFNVIMNFNVRDMDPEYVAEKTGLLEKAMMFDRNGRIDSDEALNVIFELVDRRRLTRPAWAARFDPYADCADLDQPYREDYSVLPDLAITADTTLISADDDTITADEDVLSLGFGAAAVVITLAEV